jgi:hypothetical protein
MISSPALILKRGNTKDDAKLSRNGTKLEYRINNLIIDT